MYAESDIPGKRAFVIRKGKMEKFSVEGRNAMTVGPKKGGPHIPPFWKESQWGRRSRQIDSWGESDDEDYSTDIPQLWSEKATSGNAVAAREKGPQGETSSGRKTQAEDQNNEKATGAYFAQDGVAKKEH